MLSGHSLNGLRFGSLVLAISLVTGCQKDQPTTNTDTQPVTVLDPAAEFDGLSTDELFTVIRQTNDDYDSVAKLFHSSGGRHRLTKMRQLVDRCIIVAEQIEDHAEAEEGQVKTAIGIQLRMHHQGLSMGWEEFEARTVDLASRLATRYPESIEAATADALLLKRKYLDGEYNNFGEIEAAIESHVMNFFESPTGPKLYADYARLLLNNREFNEASRVCRDVLDVYGDSPHVGPVRQVVQSIRLAKVQRDHDEAYYKSRAGEFGGHTTGYFVLFLRPNKLSYGSAVDYVVCHGIKEAVQASESSPKFDLEAWYPDTPQGRQQANAKAEELYQKNTFEMLVPN